MMTKELFAIAIRREGEERAEIIPSTLTHRHEYVCTHYDSERFSAPPKDHVYMVKVCACEVIESADGEYVEPVYAGV